MNEHKITLSTEEIEDLKDVIKFRTTVVLKLKALEGIPKKVTELTVHSSIHWVLILLVVGGIVGLAFKVLAK